MTLQIIIDTNFLLIPYQFKVDIFEEIDRLIHEPYELCIIDKTIDELNKIIAEQRGKYKEGAKMALLMLEKYLIIVLETPETERLLNVDKLILNRAKASKYAVATQDAALKRLLQKNNTRLIVLRQKKHLILL